MSSLSLTRPLSDNQVFHTLQNLPLVGSSLNFGNTTTSIETLECPICFTREDKKKMIVLPLCSHGFCQECLRYYVNEKYGTNEVPVPCCYVFDSKDSKDSICKKEISREFIETNKLVDDTILESYKKRLILKDPSAGECPKCHLVTIQTFKTHEGNLKPELTCSNPLCCHVFCLIHSDLHPNISCREYQEYQRNSNLRRTGSKLVQKLTKSCPKLTCKAPIMKNGGFVK